MDATGRAYIEAISTYGLFPLLVIGLGAAIVVILCAFVLPVWKRKTEMDAETERIRTEATIKLEQEREAIFNFGIPRGEDGNDGGVDLTPYRTAADQDIIDQGKAPLNHNHNGVYQPVGNYLTTETDPTVPAWAKQASKPTYTASEIGAAAANHNHDAAYAPISHSNDSSIHVTATDKSNWNSKAAGTHTHSASKITSGTLPVKRGGTGQTQLWTSITFTKSNSKFGSFWGSVQYYRYLDMVYFNMGISVTSGVASGSATVGTVSTTYKPAVRTQLASSLSQGHAYIDTDGKLKLYSAMSLDSGTTVYFTGWYYAGD